MLEIPRYFTANVWKLVLGIILVAAAVGLALDPAPRAAAIDNPERWTAPAMFALVGLPLIASNVRLLARRGPQVAPPAVEVDAGEEQQEPGLEDPDHDDDQAEPVPAEDPLDHGPDEDRPGQDAVDDQEVAVGGVVGEEARVFDGRQP